MNWVAMFPGQGSQQAGMGKELLDKYSDLLIDDFEETLGWSLQEIILKGNQEEVTKTNIAQPYIFAISYCYGLEVIEKIGLPKVGIGHSLGEYTALSLSGILSYKDALEIIAIRGKAMQEAVEGSNTTLAAVLTSNLESTIKERLVNQIDNSVMFYNQILNIEKLEQPESWYHIGPGNVTAGMVKKSISSKSVKVVNSLDSLNDI